MNWRELIARLDRASYEEMQKLSNDEMRKLEAVLYNWHELAEMQLLRQEKKGQHG